MHTFHTLSLALLFALAPAIAAHAADLPARGPLPFAAYDKDKSGGISPEEFYALRSERMRQRAEEGRPLRGAANAPSFESIDTDGNGQLSEAELRAGQQAHMQQSGGGPGGGGGPCGGAGGQPTFAEQDLNGDGGITEQELNEWRAKRIGERAQQGGQLRNAPNAPPFAELDANGDGSVNAEEFAAHQSRMGGVQPDSP